MFKTYLSNYSDACHDAFHFLLQQYPILKLCSSFSFRIRAENINISIIFANNENKNCQSCVKLCGDAVVKELFSSTEAG